MNTQELEYMEFCKSHIKFLEKEICDFDSLLNRIADALGMATSNEMAWDDEVECMISMIKELKGDRDSDDPDQPPI